MVKAKVSKSVNIGIPVSERVKVKFETPTASTAGVTVAVQFGAVPEKTIFATGTAAVLEEAAVNEVVQFKLESMSFMVKLIARDVSSFVVRFPMAPKTGASLAALTFTVKVSKSV